MPVDSAIPDYILESVRSLPPLPAAVNKLLSLARDPEAEFREIAAVIETDQTLTARTLKAANSALYGLPRRVETVRQATVLLGREALLSLAVGASVMSLQNGLRRAWPIDPLAFWRHNAAVATTARAIGKRLRLPDAESAFVAGLLHDIGKLILLNHFGDVYGQVLMAARDGANPLHVLEREILETDHAVVGHALCLHWNLPASLTHAIAEHHDESEPAPNSVAGVVRNANDLVKMFRFGDSGNRYAELKSSRLLPHKQIPPQALREMLLALPAEINDAERIFGDANGHRETPALSEPRALVHVQATKPEERDLISFVLLSHGYEPVIVDQNARSETGHPDLPLLGLISDLPIEPTRAVAYAQHGLPILDYAAFRSSNGQPTPDGYMDVKLFDAWIEKNLSMRPAGVQAA